MGYIILHDRGEPALPPKHMRPFTFWSGQGFVFVPRKAKRFDTLEGAQAQIDRLRCSCPVETAHWKPDSLRPVNPAAGREMYSAGQS